MTTRITQNMLTSRSMLNLRRRLDEFQQTQSRLATGKRMLRPSDDVAGMARALRTRSAIAGRQQEQLHAQDAERWISLADSKLQGVTNALQRARELAIFAANPNGPTDRDAIAAELTELRDEILGLANSESEGRRVFGGNTAGVAVTNIAGVWTYTGDNGVTMRRLSESTEVRINVLADDVFGFSGGTDVFTALDSLIADIQSDNDAGIQAGLTEMDAQLGTVLAGLGRLGAAGRRVEVAIADQVEDLNLLEIQLSNVESVDLAEAAMEFQLQETAYQAALAATSRALQPSLVDFLG